MLSKASYWRYISIGYENSLVHGTYMCRCTASKTILVVSIYGPTNNHAPTIMPRPHEGYGKADSVCVCVRVSVTAQWLQTNSFYRLLAMDFDSWICKLKFVLQLWLILLTVKAVAVSAESFVALSVRTCTKALSESRVRKS